MHQILLVLIFSALSFSTVVSAQNAVPPVENKTQQVETEDGDDSSLEFLRSDFKQVDVAAYVEVREIVSIGRSDEKTDCENFTGRGYCTFLLRAEVKELYKGKLKTSAIEFYEGAEAQLVRSRDRFLGERVIFLKKFTEGGKTHFQTLDNSTRYIEDSILEKMRRIAAVK
jgi:hypothetical protein